MVLLIASISFLSRWTLAYSFFWHHTDKETSRKYDGNSINYCCTELFRSYPGPYPVQCTDLMSEGNQQLRSMNFHIVYSVSLRYTSALRICGSMNLALPVSQSMISVTTNRDSKVSGVVNTAIRNLVLLSMGRHSGIYSDSIIVVCKDEGIARYEMQLPSVPHDILPEVAW